MNYEDSRNTSAPVNSGVVFCTQCGTQNANTSSCCSHCGNRLAAVPERAPQPPVYTQANPNNSNPYSYVNQQSNPYQTQNQYQNSGYNAYQSYQTAGVDAHVPNQADRNHDLHTDLEDVGHGAHDGLVCVVLVCRFFNAAADEVDQLEADEHDHEGDEKADACGGCPVDQVVENCLPIRLESLLGYKICVSKDTRYPSNMRYPEDMRLL
jgi:hypothetical protein